MSFSKAQFEDYHYNSAIRAQEAAEDAHFYAQLAKEQGEIEHHQKEVEYKIDELEIRLAEILKEMKEINQELRELSHGGPLTTTADGDDQETILATDKTLAA